MAAMNVNTSVREFWVILYPLPQAHPYRFGNDWIIEAARETETQTQTPTYRQASTDSEAQMFKHGNTYTYREMGRQIDRQTDRQTDRQRQREAERERQ